MSRYDTRTALIVVDVQNDFADPDGNLYVRGGEDVVPFINEQVEAARQAGATIVYTQDWHPGSTPHFQKDGGIWPVHCVGGTEGAGFHPDLVIAGETIRKGTGGEDGYSGFTMRDPVTGDETPTGLERLLRDAGAERVVVVGLATDYCVKATALDSASAGFETTVLAGGVRAVDLEPGDALRAAAEMVSAGVRIE
jgi:nicotinamidase/pyrazinamidase